MLETLRNQAAVFFIQGVGNLRTNIAQNHWKRSKEMTVDMEKSTLLRTIVLRVQDTNTRQEVLEMTERRTENGELMT